MFKMRNRILSAIMALVMIFSLFTGMNIPSVAEDDILSYLTYEINNGEVTITDCDESISGDVVIPDTIKDYPVTEIGVSAFAGCADIENIIIGSNVITIREYAFSKCNKLSSISISSSVSEIWEEALLNIENIEKFIVDENNEKYSDDERGALFNKDKTELIRYPGGNTNEEYKIPETVERIGYFTFSGASHLKTVYVPASVTHLDDNHSFSTLKNLEKIVVDDDNEKFESDENGVLFYKGKQTLLQYPVGKSETEYIVPQNVTFISAVAFLNCENLKMITIPHVNTGFFSNLSIGFIKGGNSLNKIDGFVIKGFKDSLAEKYANTYGFEFVPITDYPSSSDESTNPQETTKPTETTTKPVSDKLEVSGSEIKVDASSKTSTIGAKQNVESIAKSIRNDKFSIIDKNGNALKKDALVGTGSKIQVMSNDGKVTSEYTVIVPTDVDGNGKITAADARLALRGSAKLENVDGVYAIAADVTGDGKITAADARKILRISAGLEK